MVRESVLYFHTLYRLSSKLQLLDTAGVEQFTQMNEGFINVRCPNYARVRFSCSGVF